MDKRQQKRNIRQAKKFARRNELSQVIIMSWDGRQAVVTTYGEGIENKAQAALGGNRIKEFLGFSTESCNAQPPIVAEMIARIRELEVYVENGNDVVRGLIKDLEAAEEREHALRHELRELQGGSLLKERFSVWVVPGHRGGFNVFKTEEDAKSYISNREDPPKPFCVQCLKQWYDRFETTPYFLVNNLYDLLKFQLPTD